MESIEGEERRKPLINMLDVSAFRAFLAFDAYLSRQPYQIT